MCFVTHMQAGMSSGHLPGRSISPRCPLLAGELLLLAPNACAPSPRKEGEEESAGRHPTTQPHSNVMNSKEGRFTKAEISVSGGEMW